MPKFIFNPFAVVSFPDDKYLIDTILENNKEFTWYPMLPDFWSPVIECENKPRDLFVHGINWKPVNG
mgnify:CR=1 FL=1